MKTILLFIFFVIIVIFLFTNKSEKFCGCNKKKYPYDPPIQTPQSNYLNIANLIKKQNEYKKELSVALNPIPTVQCQKIHDKETCNNSGCNWFGNMCSAMYPSYL